MGDRCNLTKRIWPFGEWHDYSLGSAHFGVFNQGYESVEIVNDEFSV